MNRISPDIFDFSESSKELLSRFFQNTIFPVRLLFMQTSASSCSILFWSSENAFGSTWSRFLDYLLLILFGLFKTKQQYCFTRRLMELGIKSY